jgi:hypothetical protein
MRVAGAIFAMLVTPLLPLGVRGQARPSEPYVDRGVCPFECCQYRNWTARMSVPVRMRPDRRASILFRLGRGDSVRGDSGEVRLHRVGVVVLQRTHQVDGTRLTIGDTAYVLSYLGEGFYRVWIRGRVHEASAFWVLSLAPSGTPPGRLVREPKSEWWAHVTRRDGRAGWVHMDRRPMANTDACAD